MRLESKKRYPTLPCPQGNELPVSPGLLLTLALPLLLDTLRSCIGQSVYNGLGRWPFGERGGVGFRACHKSCMCRQSGAAPTSGVVVLVLTVIQ
ncbi:hypothetical protein CCHR01_12509 [Colletotrichum chrysophilum]|uniref:Uncharacterized protein n=1 Tax=Colletotrichum chrysophilum TaxID=1836956 RepID=A0AAD9EBD5_9PEZI|nr:hypothetical protein CCHR01_12509 [Colletotrichum chrysophilum]